MAKGTRNKGLIKNVPASTPEGREKQVIAKAYDLAEQQILDGTASSQVITHFLKMGSSKEAYEKEIAELKKDLLKAKTEAYQSHKKIEELYAEAMKAMSDYRGETTIEEEDFYED